MRNGTLVRGLSALAIGVAMGLATPANAQQYYGGGGYGPGYGMGPGMMYGYGPGYGMGPGMMYGYGGGYGPGMMGGYGGGYGPGMMGGYGMGPGMMYGYGPGGGYGPRGYGPRGYGYGGPGPAPQANLNLTVDQVRSNMERWLAETGNPRLKLGKVAEKDANTITADIVTTEKGVLVERYDIDRHTGFTRPEQ